MSERYLIWSYEQAAWWAPRRHGYTQHLALAGRYSRQEALDICVPSIRGDARRFGALPESPVREADVETMVAAYNAQYPSRPKPESWD